MYSGWGSRVAQQVWAKTVVEHHHLIAIEDFKPTFLARTSMARKAADAAIGACKRELVERGKRAGRKVVLVRLNAARTILATAERDRASADDVRHQITSFRDGESGAVRAGNPGPGPGGKSPGLIHGDR
jgi:putative transposase